MLEPRTFERKCPAWWSWTAVLGFLALAVILGGLGWQATAAPVPEKKVDPTKEEPQKVDPKKEEIRPEEEFPGFPNIDDLFKELKGRDAEALKQMRAEMERARQEMQKAMEAARLGQPGFGFPMARIGRFGEGRLGVRVEVPNPVLEEQLELPRGKGLVIADVQPDSAAAKAGLKRHDILLDMNGKELSSNPAEFARQIEGTKANEAFDLVVMRKGKKETLKGITLPEAKIGRKPLGLLAPEGFPGFPPNIVLPPFPNVPGQGGVMTSTVRSNDRFTTRHQEGNLGITVTGKVDQDKSVVTEITIQDGEVSTKYETSDKVPEQYRDKVKSLIEMSQKNVVRIPMNP